MNNAMEYLRGVWRGIHHNQRGCSFEDDYRLLRCLAATVVIKAQG